MKPDHIHVFVDVPQTAAPYVVVRTFKDINAIELFKAFPQLIQFYTGCGILWSKGYFVSTGIKIILRSRSVKQKSIKTYKKKTNLKISLNNLEKIE